jgi:hypothetical protein
VARAINLPAASTFSSWAQRGYRRAEPHAPRVAFVQPDAGLVDEYRVGQFPAQQPDGRSRRGQRRGLHARRHGRRARPSVSNGGLVWSADLTAGFDRGGNVSGGGLALSGDTLYVTTGYGELVALDASNGAVRWRQRLGAGIGAPTVRATRPTWSAATTAPGRSAPTWDASAGNCHRPRRGLACGRCGARRLGRHGRLPLRHGRTGRGHAPIPACAHGPRRWLAVGLALPIPTSTTSPAIPSSRAAGFTPATSRAGSWR